MIKRAARRYDAIGPVVEMARASNYVMVRRPGCAPFVLTVKEFEALSPQVPSPCGSEQCMRHCARTLTDGAPCMPARSMARPEDMQLWVLRGACGGQP